MAGITSEYNQHHIITDWQYRQAVEWDFETSYYYNIIVCEIDNIYCNNIDYKKYYIYINNLMNENEIIL